MMRDRGARRLLFIFGWFFLFLLAGCQAGRTVGGLFINEEKGYQLKLLPADWRRDKREGFDLFYYHQKMPAAVGVAAKCERATNASLSILTNHLLFGLADKTILTTREWKLSETPMLETVVEARLDKTRVRMSLVVFKKGRCIFDLEYVASPKVFALGLSDFHRMVESFALMQP